MAELFNSNADYYPPSPTTSRKSSTPGRSTPGRSTPEATSTAASSTTATSPGEIMSTKHSGTASPVASRFHSLEIATPTDSSTSNLQAPCSSFANLMALIQTENKLSFSGAAHLARRVAAKIRHCVDAGTGFYVAVSGVSEGMLDTIDNAFVNHGIRRQVRFIYESPIESLIIKCMPGSTHEIVSRRFMTKLHDKICAIPGHTEYSYDPVGSTRFSVSGKRSKEGDEGLKPADTRPHEEDWPSLMVEVGYSQTLLSLQECAHWWLTESRGQTRMVILIQVGKDPKSIRLERWECLPDPNRVSTRSRTYTKPSFLQYFDIDAAGAVSHEESHPDLVIPYNTVFDTPNPAGTDIVLSKAELSVWALHIFGRMN